MANKLNESVEKIVSQAQEKGVNVSYDELMSLVKSHSAGAAASMMAVGALPGVGSVVAAGIEIGFVWSMYYRICTKLGLSVKKNLIKGLGSAFVTNIAAYVAAPLISGTVLSLIPGLGTAGATILNGLMGYCVTYYSGIIFMNLLVRLFKAGKSIDSYTVDELEHMMKQESNNTSFRQVKKEAQQAFKNRKADGVAEAIQETEDTADDAAEPIQKTEE